MHESHSDGFDDAGTISILMQTATRLMTDIEDSSSPKLQLNLNLTRLISPLGDCRDTKS